MPICKQKEMRKMNALSLFIGEVEILCWLFHIFHFSFETNIYVSDIICLIDLCWLVNYHVKYLLCQFIIKKKATCKIIQDVGFLVIYKNQHLSFETFL